MEVNKKEVIELLDELEKIVNGFPQDWEARFDDDLKNHARGLMMVLMAEKGYIQYEEEEEK